MGMELQSRWQCERCLSSQYVAMDEVPEGWRYQVEAEILVDTESHMLDFSIGSMHQNRKLICNICSDAYHYEYMGEIRSEVTDDRPQFMESEVQTEQASADAPVEPDEDMDGVSEVEAPDLGNDVL